jgi:hypothetical protein
VGYQSKLRSRENGFEFETDIDENMFFFSVFWSEKRFLLGMNPPFGVGGDIPSDENMNYLHHAASAAEDANFFSSIEDRDLMRQLPLWNRQEFDELLAENLNPFRTHPDFRDSKIWYFWREWYQGFLDGEPLDWELQRRVALIEDEIWEAGPEAVAEEIEKIRAKFDLEQRIAALEAERDSLVAEKSRHGIGGNNPPDEMAIEPQIVKETTIIWAAIDDIKEELPKETPDKHIVLKAIEAMGRAVKAILAWCGRKGDLTVDQIIKWGVPLGGAAILANPKLVTDVIDAAKGWLAAF